MVSSSDGASTAQPTTNSKRDHAGLHHLIVLSIPHTGNRSLQAELNCERHMHTFVRSFPDWPMYRAFLKHADIATPLRDPRETWQSWVKRWVTKQGEVSLDLFEEQWYYLAQFDDEYDITYYPVESLRNCVGHIEAPGIDYDRFHQPNWTAIYKVYETIQRHVT